MTLFLPMALKFFINMDRSGDTFDILKRPEIMRSDKDNTTKYPRPYSFSRSMPTLKRMKQVSS